MNTALDKMKVALIVPLLSAAALFGRAAAEYSGLVFEDRNGNGVCDRGERGAPGVTVSDGLHVVKTDGDGCYTLPGHDRERFLFVTVPSGARAFPFYKKLSGEKTVTIFPWSPDGRGGTLPPTISCMSRIRKYSIPGIMKTGWGGCGITRGIRALPSSYIRGTFAMKKG